MAQPLSRKMGISALFKLGSFEIGSFPEKYEVSRMTFPIDTGPLTQATGPPRSCGGVAICMLRGNPVLTGNSMLDDYHHSRTNRLFNVG